MASKSKAVPMRGGWRHGLYHRIFVAHPRSVGESYAEHARIAGRFGFAMVAGGVKCLIHALVPALQQRAASDTVRRLHRQIERRRAESDLGADYII